MRRTITFGSAYQLVNLVLLLIQAVIMPRYLGLEVYGFGLLIVVPVLLVGGFWEPIVQYYSNEYNGVPEKWWLYGAFSAVMGYAIYLLAVLSFLGEGIGTIFLGLFFVLEYMFVIYVIAVYQTRKKYGELLVFSLLGLCFSALVFLFSPQAWLVCLFYTCYFFPLFVSGVRYFRNSGMAGEKVVGGGGEILNAVSTRLFYVLINNFYVIVAGFFYGPSQAALLKIVISLSSAFRFVSPLNIGHFYSLMPGVGLRRRFIISLVPLCCFSSAVLVVSLFAPVFDDYSRLLLAENNAEVIDAFLLLAWGVPFYLWSPYLTIVFFKILGWRFVAVACLVSVSLGGVAMRLYGAPAFFVISAMFYCLLIIFWGGVVRYRRIRSA